MGNRVVITGGGGFVGQWLARKLLERGDEVTLAGHVNPDRRPILDAEELSATRWVDLDVRRSEQFAGLMAGKPSLIVHLAGVSFVPQAEGAPAAAYDVNVLGTVRLLAAVEDAVNRGHCDPVVLIVGSGTQYGAHPVAAMPLPESAEQRPLSIYAATKAAQEVAALQIARTTAIKVVCTRSFSHSGIGHAEVFLLPSLVGRIRKSVPSSGILKIGNDVVRDYLHVDDAVDAYLAIAEKGRPGDVYNVCSGIGISVGDIAREALRRAGIAAEIVPDPTLERATDMPILIGSPAKLIAETGWRPRKTHVDILEDLLRT